MEVEYTTKAEALSQITSVETSVGIAKRTATRGLNASIESGGQNESDALQMVENILPLAGVAANVSDEVEYKRISSIAEPVNKLKHELPELADSQLSVGMNSHDRINLRGEVLEFPVETDIAAIKKAVEAEDIDGAVKLVESLKSRLKDSTFALPKTLLDKMSIRRNDLSNQLLRINDAMKNIDSQLYTLGDNKPSRIEELVNMSGPIPTIISLLNSARSSDGVLEETLRNYLDSLFSAVTKLENIVGSLPRQIGV